MVPPYDVELLVEESSVPRYERAFPAVQVPKALGRLLTRTDIRDSLRRGGSIPLTVACWLDGRYVAERVARLIRRTELRRAPQRATNRAGKTRSCDPRFGDKRFAA